MSTFTALWRSGTIFRSSQPAFFAVDRDRVVEIELLGHALARKLAEPPQRDLDVARADLDAVVEVPEFALVPDFHGAAMLRFFLPDADAFRVVAVRAERARARGADPLGAALVPPLLLFEPLLQRLHELVPAAERLDELLLLLGQILLRELLQPLFGNLHDERIDFDDAFEVGREHAVEAVEVLLVLNQARAREVVEVLRAAERDLLLEGLDERQELADRDRDAARFKLEEKLN